MHLMISQTASNGHKLPAWSGSGDSVRSRSSSSPVVRGPRSGWRSFMWAARRRGISVISLLGLPCVRPVIPGLEGIDKHVTGPLHIEPRR